jgi:hypothetical protein
MKASFYNILVLTLLLGAGMQSHAERGDTLINPHFELANLVSHFANDSLYQMDAYLTYDHSDSSSHHIYDTVHITYTISGDNYQVMTDTTEEVQNGLYNVKVDNVDSFITISSPRAIFPMVVQADIYGPTFQPYLSNLHVVDSGSLRNILADFQLSSPYYSYLIAYDSALDFIAVKYSMRNHIPLTPSGSYTISAPAYDYTNLIMSIYITLPSPRPSGLFDAGKYFTRSGDTFIPKAPYANYQVINLLQNQ